jgi:hypothetical protein
MYTKILILAFLHVCAAVFAQTSDGLLLNIRLHPVQILSVNNTETNSAKENALPEYVTVTSPSGFQVKVKHEIYNDREKKFSSSKNQNCNKEYNLVNNPKGVVYKMYKINQNVKNAIKKSECAVSEQNHLVFTLISQ